MGTKHSSPHNRHSRGRDLVFKPHANNLRSQRPHSVPPLVDSSVRPPARLPFQSQALVGVLLFLSAAILFIDVREGEALSAAECERRLRYAPLRRCFRCLTSQTPVYRNSSQSSLRCIRGQTVHPNSSWGLWSGDAQLNYGRHIHSHSLQLIILFHQE
jgi:hypothetical protein